KETQNKRDRYEQLERIGKLRDSGVLTQKEFEMEKKRILEQ
ncbi:MAG: SHOCT domain-containing protein, partial [Mailhella sp.]|nr:SHOCT domain-containing protein [Mailhella sp.]